MLALRAAANAPPDGAKSSKAPTPPATFPRAPAHPNPSSAAGEQPTRRALQSCRRVRSMGPMALPPPPNRSRPNTTRPSSACKPIFSSGTSKPKPGRAFQPKKCAECSASRKAYALTRLIYASWKFCVCVRPLTALLGGVIRCSCANRSLVVLLVFYAARKLTGEETHAVARIAAASPRAVFLCSQRSPFACLPEVAASLR